MSNDLAIGIVPGAGRKGIEALESMAIDSLWAGGHIASHNPTQVFCFGPDGLLRRHDYTMELVGDVAIADYTDDHQVFGGISFPTLRRAVGRQPDGTTVLEPAFVTIDIAHITVESMV